VGLTLARRLAELQGGRISAASEGVGRGSEFTGSGPGESERVERPPEARPAAAAHLDLQVLIVDDNRDVADSTALLLRAAGCNVDLAYDGEEALRSLRALRPDAVLLDIGLPKVDGYQVAKHVRAEGTARPPLLIALSGYGQDEHRLRSQEAGFDYHIVKPIDPAALTGLLASLRTVAKADVPPAPQGGASSARPVAGSRARNRAG
jgi:CheY-like chemotaxis protein